MNLNQQSILNVATDIEESGQRMMDISEEIQIATSSAEIADAIQRLNHQIDILNGLRVCNFDHNVAGNSDIKLISSHGGKV